MYVLTHLTFPLVLVLLLLCDSSSSSRSSSSEVVVEAAMSYSFSHLLLGISNSSKVSSGVVKELVVE